MVVLMFGTVGLTLAHNARRLCEVFCISQNLQMYEVPERASDGKASGRCSGSPKGFRYIVSGLAEGGDFLVQKFNRITNVEPCTNAQPKNFSPAFGKPLLADVYFFNS